MLLFKRTTEMGVILHTMQYYKRLYCSPSVCFLLVRLGSAVVSICLCTTNEVAVSSTSYRNTIFGDITTKFLVALQLLWE